MTREDKIKIKSVIDSITDEQLQSQLERIGPYNIVHETFIKLLCDQQAFEYYGNMLVNRIEELFKKQYKKEMGEIEE